MNYNRESNGSINYDRESNGSMNYDRESNGSMNYDRESIKSTNYNKSNGSGSIFTNHIQNIIITSDVNANNIESISNAIGSSSSRDNIALSSQDKKLLLSEYKLIRENDILLYLNSFNISDIDPRNIITIVYSFNTYVVSNLSVLQSTGIESLIANILNIDNNSVSATNLINDVNNNTIITFKITYSQLSQSTAALTNIDDTLQLPTNARLIYSALNGCTSFTLIGKPSHGDASSVNTTYWCSLNTWCDFKRPSIKFNLKGKSVPIKITTSSGLDLNNIELFGPPSNKLSISSNNILKSFTIVFYMKINSLSYNLGNSIILYQMYSETPNMIRLAIYSIILDNNKIDPNFSTLELIIGNQYINYRWTIPNSTLMSNGYISLYALEYDSINSICYFYIGTTKYTAHIEKNSDEPIVLSITPIAINKGAQSIDANLYSFIYYNGLLSETELFALKQYFDYELEGIPIMQKNNLQAIYQTQQLQSLIQKTQNTINYSKQCNPCKGSENIAIKSKKSPVPEQSINIGQNPWIVNYNKNIDKNKLLQSDLKQCDILQLNEVSFGKSKKAPESKPLSYKAINIDGPARAENTRRGGGSR